MAKILIVDDHEIVRQGIRGMLSPMDDINVVGEAESGQDALQKIAELSPDVVLMDVFMPEMDGIETTRLIMQRHPSIRVIALTAHADDVYPQEILNAGAISYVTKDVRVDEILMAIRSALRGKRYIESTIAEQLINEKAQENPFDLLSRREKQITVMVVQGFSYQEIANRLHLAVNTVNTNRYRVFDKLAPWKIDNDVKLTRLAIEYGLDKICIDDM